MAVEAPISTKLDAFVPAKTNAKLTPKAMRQAIFIQAFKASRLNISRACRRVGVHRSTIHLWRKNDRQFREAFWEASEEIADFIEDALLRLVRKGDRSAVIFAAKCRLRHRGYGQP